MDNTVTEKLKKHLFDAIDRLEKVEIGGRLSNELGNENDRAHAISVLADKLITLHSVKNQ